jgi:predicted N-acetyltransferase YhbS
MRAIEEKQAAKFAKQREHQKAFDKLRKQREYAENVRFKAKEMLDKSV